MAARAWNPYKKYSGKLKDALLLTTRCRAGFKPAPTTARRLEDALLLTTIEEGLSPEKLANHFSPGGNLGKDSPDYRGRPGVGGRSVAASGLTHHFRPDLYNKLSD